MTQEKVERWVIRRWQGHVNVPLIFAKLDDTHFTGRVMLHFHEGNVIAAETCEHADADVFELVGEPT
jgi:hypothetical protein